MIINGDCLEILPTLAPESVDLILADMPYGTTAAHWDKIIRMEALWPLLERVARTGCPVVLFGQQPFTSYLIMSNTNAFRHSLVWEKSRATGHLNSKHAPMRAHEDISVFSFGVRPNYYPEKTSGHVRKKTKRGTHSSRLYHGQPNGAGIEYDSTDRLPRSVIRFDSANRSKTFHPTEKPVDLLRYLVRTYSKRGDTVLDFCMGSGSAGEAALLEGRCFIGIEKDASCFELAQTRIKNISGDFEKTKSENPAQKSMFW